MNAVSMNTSSYASRIILQSQQQIGNALIQLMTALNHVEVAQAKPLANLNDTSRFDTYA